MCLRALTISAIACLLTFAPLAPARQAPSTEQILSFLRTASALVPKIENSQGCNVAANIAIRQAQVGDLAGALATLRSGKGSEGIIAPMLAWQGNVELALNLVQNSGSSEDTKAVAHSGVALQLAWRGDFDNALRVIRIMESAPPFLGKTKRLIDTLTGIQTMQWQTGDHAGAQSTLGQALDAVDHEIAHPFTPEFADTLAPDLYGEIARALSEEGNQAAALDLIHRVSATMPFAESPEGRQRLLYTVAVTEADMGRFAEAARIAEPMSPGQWRDGALMILAMKRGDAGEPEEAVEEAIQVSSAVWRNASLRGVAVALAASGNSIAAISTIDRIQGADERADAYSQLAYEQARKKDPAASLTLEIAMEAAWAAGSATEPYVFAQIAVTRGMLGDFSGALEVVGKMAEEERYWAVEALAAMLVEAGKKTEALALAESQPEVFCARASAFAGIASQLIEEKEDAERKNRVNLN